MFLAVNKFPGLKILPQHATAALVKYVVLPLLRLAGIPGITAETAKIVLTVPAYFKHVSPGCLLPS